MIDLIPLLADISAEDVGKIISYILGCGGLGGGAYLLGKAKAVHIQPQPLEVSAAKQYATKQELDELREEIKDDIGKLYKKLNSTSEQLAQNTGTLNQINNTLTQLLTRHLKA